MSEVSDLSRGLEQVLGPLDVNVGGYRLSHLRQHAAQSLTAFAELAHQSLNKMGVQLPPAVDVFAGEDSLLEIDLRHPDAPLAEAALCNDIELARRFKETEVLHELLRAIDCVGDVPPTMHAVFHVGLTSMGPVAFFA